MARQISIIVTHWFDGIHQWVNAPAKVAFLRCAHRHQFKVVAEVAVDHLDRDKEFFILISSLKRAISDMVPQDKDGVFLMGEMSCEMVATYLLEKCGLLSCSVWEDGVNGALVREE